MIAVYLLPVSYSIACAKAGENLCLIMYSVNNYDIKPSSALDTCENAYEEMPLENAGPPCFNPRIAARCSIRDTDSMDRSI
jgi:hypothetical protein